MAFFRKKTRKKATPHTSNQSTQTESYRPRKLFSPEVKLHAVKALEAGLTPLEVSEIVGSGSSTVNGWAKAYREGGLESLFRKPTNAATRRICDTLARRIEQERLENPEAGVRRIRDELKRHEGVKVSAETVRRVVNEAGLGNPAHKPTRQAAGVKRFEKELPNALWQIDIFTFQLKRMYPVYLVGIIDDHSRYIVGHGLFRQQSADAVLEVVKGAIGEWGAPREILSDNGRQFAAWRGETRFQKVLKRQGIGHVRSAPRHPMTLGKIERFWKTIWEEFIAEALFVSFADASQRIAHWIAYYNHQRPHQGIGGGCPADRFYGLAEDIEEATRQGCRENALRLALGQETKPPLYLLGKLGGTDVRVTRKGDDLEVKLGDTIHEVIRTGLPCTVDDDGRLMRGEPCDEVEGSGRGGEVPGVGDGTQGGSLHEGDLQNLRDKPTDLESCHGEDGSGFDSSPGAEKARQEAQDAPGGGDGGAYHHERRSGERTGALEAEVRGGQDIPGSREEAGAGREAAWRGGTIGEKNRNPIQEEEGEEINECGEPFWPQGDDEDGPFR
jgi:transposase InsO family protein